MAVPASRYRSSLRPFPSRLPQPHYEEGETVRKVSSTKDYLSFKGRLWRVPDAFCGESLAIRLHAENGRYGIFFGATQIADVHIT